MDATTTWDRVCRAFTLVFDHGCTEGRCVPVASRIVIVHGVAAPST